MKASACSLRLPDGFGLSQTHRGVGLRLVPELKFQRVVMDGPRLTED